MGRPPKTNARSRQLRVSNKLYVDAKKLFESLQQRGITITMEDAYFRVKSKSEQNEENFLGWNFK